MFLRKVYKINSYIELMIVVRAPLRISLGGGGTDLPFFSTKYGGNVTSVAIDKYIYVMIQKRHFYNNFLIRYSQTEITNSVDEIRHTRIKATLNYLNIKEPLEITSIADVPEGTGLGSSSTFLVALLKGLYTYKGQEVSAFKLAEDAAEIEMKILKEPIGKHDQYMASFGGLINLEIGKNGKVLVSPIDVRHESVQQLEENLLLFSTEVRHSASSIIVEQKKSLESDVNKMNQMKILKDLGEDIRKTLEEGDLQKFGRWMNVHWETKRKFSKSMTSSQIDYIYEMGLKSGAIGGKLVGAGGGGFLLFYCDNKKDSLRISMAREGLKELKFKFDQEGCRVIYNEKL